MDYVRGVLNKLLRVDHPADLILIFNEPETESMIAIKENNVLGIKNMITSGALKPDGTYLRQSDQQPVINFAVAQGKREIVRLLLLYNANPNLCDTTGTTPLMRAFGLGRTDIARELLKYGADLTLKDRDGMTCIDYANTTGHTEMLQLLRNPSAELDQFAASESLDD